MAVACERLSRETYAPLVPSVLLGASYGGFGGGWATRSPISMIAPDFDAIAVWQVRNLGFGEQAARESALADARATGALREVQVMDQIAREVTGAASPRARAAEPHRSRPGGHPIGSRIVRPEFQPHPRRTGLPIEVFQAIQSLDATQRELVDATVDFNVARSFNCKGAWLASPVKTSVRTTRLRG